jgi:hypothetical protein
VVGGVRQVGVCRGRAAPGRQVIGWGVGQLTHRFGAVAAEIDHPLAQARVRGEDAVVAVAVDAWRWDEAAQRGEKLEGGEGEDGAAVAGGSRRQVYDLADAGIAL